MRKIASSIIESPSIGKLEILMEGPVGSIRICRGRAFENAAS
ncbi:hypothetical protein RRSWK_01824 [Rhodopirellula sp. SWK7]|nr:hypothetical protein RRSWK_01824 [Rhodopirellula sp. SWK7]